MTAPTLSSRASREQRVFRTLLDCMARPGRVATLPRADWSGRFAAAITVLECLLDHEVSFAVLPDEPEVAERLRRYTGCRSVDPEYADFIYAFDDCIGEAIDLARLGTFEYPDRNATLVVQVSDIAELPGAGDRLRLSGPGIRDTADIWLSGFGPELRALLVDKNVEPPLGVDVILVTANGRVTCLPRYTRIQEVGA